MSHLLDLMLKPDVDMDIGSIILPDDINNIDMPLSFDNSELMSSDFFDSVLSMEKQSFDGLDDGFLNEINNISSDENTIASPIHNSASPENFSLDSDQFSFDSGHENITIFGNECNEILNSSEAFAKIKQPNIHIDEIIGGVTNPSKVVIRQPNNNPKKVIVTKPINSANGKQSIQLGKKQVIRVQSLSGNGRSLLLPVNVKNVKKFKIINANDLKVDNIKVIQSRLPSSCQQVIKKVEQYAASTSSESVDDIDVDIENLSNERTNYPPLELTAEEKRLLMKDGIKLPTHYPLTKHEEKELKRIRRKIRNKISAQDSRKRKKEYVDQLEEKARRTDEENEILKKRVKLLNKENTRLYEQLKKLQDLLFNSSSKATPTACLMIVLFSTLLVCLPNLHTSENNKDVDVQDQQLGTRRALLYQKPTKEDEEPMSLEEFLIFKEENEMHFEEEEKENGTNSLVKYLGDLSKKYETIIRSNCSEILQGGSLQEFCRKHEDDFKLALHNLKNFMDTNNIEEKKFIEPDISDDEGDTSIKKSRNAYLLDDDDPPTVCTNCANTVSTNCLNRCQI